MTNALFKTIVCLLIATDALAIGSQGALDSAIQLAVKGKTAAAEKQLTDLLKKVDVKEADHVLMALARVQFQTGSLDKASATLDKVPKSSDFWFEALEEKAWVALRQKNPDKALSHLETGLKKIFLPLVGPETYFLASYAHLRTCNYEKSLSILELFKKEFRPRIVSLQEITSLEQPTPAMTKALEAFISKGYSVGSLKSEAHLLPRLLVHDAKLTEAFKDIKSTNSSLSKAKFFARLKQLAQTDLDELSRIINQFQVLEVEITQRVYTKQPLASALKGADKAPKMDEPTRIRFKDDGEVWLDEVDKYHVRVKGCVPQGRGQGTEGKAI